MKRLIFAALTLVLTISAVSLSPNSAGAQSEPLIQGTEVPFPFGTEIPFPWAAIEGIWEIKDKETGAYFSFQVQQDDRGVKILRVLHVDKVTRQTLGMGAGFANNEQKIVRAVMAGDGFSYLIFVRVFKDPKATGSKVRTATVLTIRELGASNVTEQHFVLRKVSSAPIKGR